MRKKYFKVIASVVAICLSLTIVYGQNESSTNACKAKFIYSPEQAGEVTFEAIVSQGTHSFEWNFGDGNHQTTSQTKLGHVYKKPGIYEVCLKTIDSSGCTKLVCKKVVPSFSSPCTAAFISIKNGRQVDFAALTPGADVFNWNFGDGTSSTGRYVRHTYASVGSYQVSLIISDSSSMCTDTAIAQVHVNAMSCTADYTFNKDSTGGVWFYSASKPSGLLHFWDFDDGSSSILANPVHQYRSAGTFNVTLVVQDTVNACMDTITKQIQISAPPRFDVRGRVSVGGSFATDGLVYLYEVDSIQKRYYPVDTVKISASPVTGEYRFRNVGIGNYLIKAVLGDKDPKYGAYLPSYAGSNQMYWNTNSSMRISSNSGNLYNIDLVRGSGTFGPAKIKGRVFDAGTGSGLQGTKDVPLLLLDAQQKPIATTLTNTNGEYEFPTVAYGVYILTLDWPGANQVNKVVILNPNRPISSSNDFITTNGAVALGEEEIETKNLALYPNPARERLYIGTELFGKETLSIQVLSVEGRVMLQEVESVLGRKNIELDLSQLSEGLYLVRVVSGKESFYGRFLKY